MEQCKGWLVESKHPTTKQPQWLKISRSFGNKAAFAWTVDANEALRLCRLEDAVRFMSIYATLEDGCTKLNVTEHVWVED